MRYYVYYILFFILYTAIHYLEGLSFSGPFSFAQLWKIPVLMYLLWFCNRQVDGKPMFERSTYWLALESFFCHETLINPISSFVYTSKLLPFVLFVRFFYEKFKNRINLLEKILYAFAQYICLASLLSLSGIVEPLTNMISAESFGVEGLQYFSGLFGAPHAAGAYCCIAILILFNGFIYKRFESNISKFFNFALIAVGLISLFKSYVRTSWLMLLVGVVCFIDFHKISARKAFSYLILLILCITGIVFFYNNNEAFRNRIAGVNIYSNQANEIVDLGGSGRLTFWYNGINNWADGNIIQILFGSGYTKVIQDNYQTTGIEVFSHNLFVDTLAQHGAIGLVLLLVIFYSLLQFILKIPNNCQYKRLCIAAYCGNVVFAFFQGLMYFDYAIAFAIIFAVSLAHKDTYTNYK